MPGGLTLGEERVVKERVDMPDPCQCVESGLAGGDRGQRGGSAPGGGQRSEGLGGASVVRCGGVGGEDVVAGGLGS